MVEHIVTFLFYAVLLSASIGLRYLLVRWSNRSDPRSLKPYLLRGVIRSGKLLPVVVGIYIAAEIFERYFSADFTLHDEFRVFTVLSLTLLTLYIPYQWVDLLSEYSKANPTRAGAMIKSAVIYRRPTHILLIFIFVLITLQVTGFDIQTILLAGGIGGLIAAFALKELLGDFFSGLTLHINPMIRPGDVIRLTEKNIEGTIIDIGFRMTNILTFERKPLLVPNSLITNTVVENLSHINSRRIQFVVGVRYQDYPKVEAIVKDLREQLAARPSIVDYDNSLIYFREFASHSLDIMIRVFTNQVVYNDYCMEYEKILHLTANVIEQHGAEFAFPTSVVYVESNGGNSQPLPHLDPSERQHG